MLADTTVYLGGRGAEGKYTPRRVQKDDEVDGLNVLE
jgi:hypothetical protein